MQKVQSKQVSVTLDQYLEFLIYALTMLIWNELLFSVDRSLGIFFSTLTMDNLTIHLERI